MTNQEFATNQSTAPLQHARNIWSIRGSYFWYYAAIGAFMPFAALYYRDLGYTGFQIGLLTALPSLGTAVLGPFLGALADSRALHHLILRVSLLAAALIGFTMTRFTDYAPIFLLVCLLAVSTVAIPPLLDSFAMTTSERTNRSYGSLRVWGSLGYMLLTLIMGWLIGDDMSPIVLMGYGMCVSLTLLGTYGLPPMGERVPQSMLGGLGMALRNRPLVLLLGIAFLVATCGSLINVFLAVHLESLGASSGLIGVAFSISAVTELPIIAGGGWLIRRLGPVGLMFIAISAYLIRFSVLAVAEDPAVVIGTQLLHGLSFGAFLMASVTLAHRIAGRAQAATAQSLLSAMSFGLGSIVGSLIGGSALDRIGTTGIYQAAAVISVGTLVIAIVGTRRIALLPATEASSL